MTGTGAWPKTAEAGRSEAASQPHTGISGACTRLGRAGGIPGGQGSFAQSIWLWTSSRSEGRSAPCSWQECESLKTIPRGSAGPVHPASKPSPSVQPPSRAPFPCPFLELPCGVTGTQTGPRRMGAGRASQAPLFLLSLCSCLQILCPKYPLAASSLAPRSALGKTGGRKQGPETDGTQSDEVRPSLEF